VTSINKKYRVNTTISIKHRELLDKQVEKYGTQQIVLEKALESMDNSNHPSQLSEEQEIWLRLFREINDILVVFPRELTKILTDTMDLDEFQRYIQDAKQVESVLEYNYKKHLCDFSLPELINGIITNIKIQGSTDTVECTEKEDYYQIYLTHRLGIKHSKAMIIMNESVFKNYRVKFESSYSERSVFFKIYKNKIKK
jgi:hypothetical protein